jgi:diguanylate cyclase (GGDEF)-like protein
MGAALLLSSLALAFWVHHSLREAQIKSAEQSAQLLAENLAPALAFHDRPATRDALVAFSRREGLESLVVREPGGEGFAHWPDAASSAPWSDTPVQVGWQGLRLVVPVQLHGDRIGSLAWAESFDALNATLLRLAAGAVAVLALALLGASLLLRWTQRRALAPLIALSRLAERVASSQDYSLRASVGEHDEVGRLAERFNGMLRRIEVWHEDMNQQLAQEQQTGRAMQQLAHRDALTGLPNRLAFELTLERLFVDLHHPGHVGGQRLALLFIDLDNFKRVNDSLGHAAGDTVLIEVSRRMSSVLRASDTLFRLGGDEFALLVADVAEPAPVEQLAERLIASVREPLLVQGQVQPVGATVGLAFVPDDATDPETLLCAADAAMYAAKHAGKNTYRRASREPAAGA